MVWGGRTVIFRLSASRQHLGVSTTEHCSLALCVSPFVGTAVARLVAHSAIVTGDLRDFTAIPTVIMDSASFAVHGSIIVRSKVRASSLAAAQVVEEFVAHVKKHKSTDRCEETVELEPAARLHECSYAIHGQLTEKEVIPNKFTATHTRVAAFPLELYTNLSFFLSSFD